jgi:hypothetical protein
MAAIDISQLFLQRYDALYNFWLADLWTQVPDELMRQRPHPQVNSIAWNLWHLTRVEDAGMNRYIMDLPQVLVEGGWMQKVKVPWRHLGSGMTFAEVDELDVRIDVQSLHGYSDAVQKRTREIINQLDPEILETTLEEERLRTILFDEGLAYSNSPEILKNYLGWTRGKCLMNFGMTHPYQHVGEIGVIASLLGVSFD